MFFTKEWLEKRYSYVVYRRGSGYLGVQISSKDMIASRMRKPWIWVPRRANFFWWTKPARCATRFPGNIL